ncbi:hypothetical protein H0H92_005697 [Tricholoma furcatifolium]|nr:hypothetical protein H0H92_005697 [Tricholoma furcatifolium]
MLVDCCAVMPMGNCPLCSLCTYIPSKWCGNSRDKQDREFEEEVEREMNESSAREAELFQQQPQTKEEMEATARFRDKSAIAC